MTDQYDRFFSQPAERLTPGDYAMRRLPGRLYAGKSFALEYESSRDVGQPARFINIVFDQSLATDGSAYEWETTVLRETPRVQITMMVAREQGSVRKLKIQKIKTIGKGFQLETLLELDREQTGHLIDSIKILDRIPIEGDERLVVDEEVLRAILEDPQGLDRLYARDKDLMRELIREDSSAKDLIALAHRREELVNFKMLLEEPDHFEAERLRLGGPEKVWQNFLERNPWILGVGLAGQILTSWDSDKLEQVVAGYSIAGGGKRADALLRTSGLIRSMVFAEIKHHNTALLETEPYRRDCWAPSHELSGGVTQVQQTVYRAVQHIGERLVDTDDDGSDLNTETYLVRPRSFLIIGHMQELHGAAGGVHQPKHRSFELYRRNLYEPEILTFDELLARAEWHLQIAEHEDEL